jgi:transposase
MKKFRRYAQKQPYLLPPSLDELISPNELVRAVDSVVEKLSLKELEARYADDGRPAYHPEMMLKVLVYAYCTKVYLTLPRFSGQYLILPQP